MRSRSILNLGKPDTAGQIAGLAGRIADLERRFALIESGQAAFGARIDGLSGGVTIFSALGRSDLPAYAVTGFPAAANALDARLIALGY